MNYTAEEEFYGRTVYESTPVRVRWENLVPEIRDAYIRGARTACAAVYVNRVQEVANKLFVACNGCMPHGGGNAGRDYLKMAEAAIAMGAKP